MQLSNEDSLRLNVLLAQDLKAVRVDESKMIVHALTGKGEVKVVLNPTCKDERYTRLVKELLSNKIMGSPGGYPVYIKRWTRMGQERREQSLAQLLLLGEEEAVIAVVHAPVLTAEIARHAWWAYPSADNARRLLEKREIAESDLARELAEFLLEFLPFEEDHRNMIDSVRLCLQPGLLTEAEVVDLWTRAKRRQSLYVGFLHSSADALPEVAAAHPEAERLEQALAQLLAKNNPYARQLLRYLSQSGQAYLKTVFRVFDKAATQDTVVSMFLAFARYHSKLKLSESPQRDILEAIKIAQAEFDAPSDPQLSELVVTLPEQREKIISMLVFAQMGEVTLYPIFGVSDALGSVMRKKLKPLTDPLRSQLSLLLA